MAVRARVSPAPAAAADLEARIQFLGRTLFARSFEDAVALANDSDYGLTGGVYSRRPTHIELAGTRATRRQPSYQSADNGSAGRTSAVRRNQAERHGSKAGGPDYLLQFCEPRTITENTMRHGLAPVDSAAPSSSAH